MEVKGKVILVLPIQEGISKNNKPWKKASIVIETEGQYPKKIAMDSLKNAEEFAKLTPGTAGAFHIEVSSNEFNGRWYTSVNCYKWETASPYPQQPLPYGQPMQGAYPPQGAGAFYGQQTAAPVNPQSATPTLDSMGVQGYQQMPQTPPAQNGDDDLPF